MNEMLYPYQIASEKYLSCMESLPEDTPGRLSICLLDMLDEWFNEEGEIHYAQGSKAIYVIYKRVAFSPADFFEEWGQIMAQLDENWPVCVYGTAQTRETVRLEAHQCDGKIKMTQKNISGKKANQLEDCCLQVELPDVKSAENMQIVLKSFHIGKNTVAFDWKYADFLKEQKIAWIEQGYAFCYLSIDERPPLNQCLEALDFSQKKELWDLFLKDGFQPLEFEWLAELSKKGMVSDLLEWELSLKEVLTELGYRVENTSSNFALIDGSGKRLYYGIDHLSAAEKFFLKMIFPINFS